MREGRGKEEWRGGGIRGEEGPEWEREGRGGVRENWGEKQKRGRSGE